MIYKSGAKNSGLNVANIGMRGAGFTLFFQPLISIVFWLTFWIDECIVFLTNIFDQSEHYDPNYADHVMQN